jgi:hypothetical protein
MLKAGVVGLAGPVAGSIFGAQALQAAAKPDASAPDQQVAFQAVGPPPVSGAAFDATGTFAGAPVFTTGVQAAGTTFGVKGFGPKTGVYGAGASSGVFGANTANGTGVVGVSYTDSTAMNHGSGAGVEGSSGTGFGVFGTSQSGPGVYGQSSMIGVSGQGALGVQGLTVAGVGVTGEADSGVGVKALSGAGTALTASNASDQQPAISALNDGTYGAIHASSSGGYGILGSSSATPKRFGTGSGVVGNHSAGSGVGVAGFSLQNQQAAHNAALPHATGVYGLGDNAGVTGHSSGVGVEGASLGGATGVLGISFHDGSQTTHGAGSGVVGNSGSGSGVAGFSHSGVGVYGQSDAGIGLSGRAPTGVQGEGLGGKGIGVLGNTGSGMALKGSAITGHAVFASNRSPRHPSVFASNGGSGNALEGTSNQGYGAELHGGRAPLRLVPGKVSGHPRSGSHQQGELVMDSAGRIYVCVRSGSPGVWRELMAK